MGLADRELTSPTAETTSSPALQARRADGIPLAGWFVAELAAEHRDLPRQPRMGAHVALEAHPAVVGHATDGDGSCDVLGARFTVLN
jgi:hypothetical protein